MNSVVLNDTQMGDASALRQKSIKRVEVRLLRASRAAHDARAERPGQWKRGIASLRMAANIPALWVGLRTPLNEEVVKDREQFARLLSLLPGVHWVVEKETPDVMDSQYEMLRSLYQMAHTHGVQIRLASNWGDLDGPLDVEVETVSMSLMHCIQQGGYWGNQGTQMEMPESGGDFYHGFVAGRSLGNLGFELKSHGFSVRNLPACLGGAGTQIGESTLYGTGCAACSRRDTCLGVPKDLALMLTDDSEVEPLPLWTGMLPNAVISVPLVVEPALADIVNGLSKTWVDAGMRVCSSRDGADFLFFESVAELSRYLLANEDWRGRRLVCWDSAGTGNFESIAARFDPNGRRHSGVDWWPGPELVLLATDPRRVRKYRDIGFPLRWIQLIHRPVQIDFVGLPMSFGSHYRPQEWPGQSTFRECVQSSDFVVLDHLDKEHLDEAFALTFGAGRFPVALSDSLSRWWIDGIEKGRLVRRKEDVEDAIARLLRRPEEMAYLTRNAREFARHTSVASLAKRLLVGA